MALSSQGIECNSWCEIVIAKYTVGRYNVSLMVNNNKSDRH